MVSVQATPGSPLAAPEHMAALARAAQAGGADGIRAEGRADIAAIEAAVNLPIIGLCKREVPGTDVYLTPTLEDAREVLGAGADLVAVDATDRPRADGTRGAGFVAALADEIGPRVVADVDDLAAGVAAAEAGAAAVATTLAGYLGDGPPPADPDLRLVRVLAERVVVPVLAEGRYATAEQVRAAFAAGAFAVVVGTAITDAVALTRGLVAATPDRGNDAAR